MIDALGWGLVAGSAFILGGALALRLKISTRSVGLLTAFGAGALFAAVAYELVAEAGQLAGGSGRVGIGLIVGSLLYLFATDYWESPDEEVEVNFRSLVVIVVVLVQSPRVHRLARNLLQRRRSGPDDTESKGPGARSDAEQVTV